ncbi:MAG TPA: hypothetical protein PK127_02520 [Clostridiales bacterium]|nr:hypothetical protein [Clostridiales bacterium]HPV01341.1 hypothetical protein [Clostridiales bacterium]
MPYLIPPLSLYLRLHASHRKSRLLRVLQRYRICDDRLESYSIIPKRIFKGREDDARVLRELLRSTGLMKQ